MPACFYRRPYARFLRWLGIMLGSYFTVACILSLTVNPWRINDTPLSIDALDASREISSTVRVGKAALANRGDWDVVILGSSRIEIAFDPTHPVFSGKQTANLAMSAANIMENVPAGDYIMNRNPKIKTMIFGIDAGDLHNNHDSRPLTRFYESPFADNNRSIERLIDQNIGGRTFLDSIATIKRHINKTSPIRNPLGLWLEPTNPSNIRNYVESSFRLRQDRMDTAWDPQSLSLNDYKVDLLAGFIDRVRAANIHMLIVIPPQHALKQIHPSDNIPNSMLWEKDLMTLTEICKKANQRPSSGPPVELWSFLTFNEYTTRPMPSQDATNRRMDGWFDLGHCHTEFGDLALNTLFSGEPGANSSATNIGVNLLENDWDTLRAEWIRGHEAYCKSQSEDVAWLRSILKNRPTRTSKSQEIVR